MSAKSAIASVSDGLRATDVMSDPKTIPIPAPAPASAIVAQPAPINFAPCI